MKTLYEAAKNADSTEGRGPMITIALFEKIEDAVVAVQGLGTMGVGDGEVNLIPVFESLEEFEEKVDRGKTAPKQLVYGYRKDWNDKWGYGYVDNRDAPVLDADYVEYKRLQAKLTEKYRGKIPD